MAAGAQARNSADRPGRHRNGSENCDLGAAQRSHLGMSEQPDAQLIAQILGGDVDSFRVLVHRHRDTCTRFAVRMLGSHADADDVLQSAFMRAYRGLSTCRDRERFGGWLYRIVVNECRTFATRQRQRDLRFVNDAEVIERAEAKRDDASGEEMSEQIELALAKLPVEQREAFLLKYVEEMSYEDMSAATGVSVPALKMRVKRASDALRRLLEGVLND
jgi:RNA polymerase sigma-70 factor (ECF subfamily)